MRCLTSLLAVALLAGCASTVPKLAPALPPVDLMQDCPVPVTGKATNGELVRAREALVGAIKDCNLDKKALRDWADKATNE